MVIQGNPKLIHPLRRALRGLGKLPIRGHREKGSNVLLSQWRSGCPRAPTGKDAKFRKKKEIRKIVAKTLIYKNNI